MPADTNTKLKTFSKDRVLRFKPVIFLRKNIIILSTVMLISLTFIFKVWDIKNYEIYELKTNEITQEQKSEIRKYFEENMQGENFFVLSLQEHQNKMYQDISYVENIQIEKILPNKILIYVEMYKPLYTADLKSHSCFVLSRGGVILEEICDKDTACCTEYSTTNNLPYLSSSYLGVSNSEGGKSRFLPMDDIEKFLTVLSSVNYEASSIIIENEILEVKEKGGKMFRLSIAEEIEVQASRFLAVVGKIHKDSLNFSILDLRFERPVMTE